MAFPGFFSRGANLWPPPKQGPNIVGGSGVRSPPRLDFFSKIELNFIQKYNKFQNITILLSIKVYNISSVADFFGGGGGAVNFWIAMHAG